MTEYKHLHAEAQSVMCQSDEERILFMHRPRWIGYPGAKFILERLEFQLKIPKKDRMEGLLIIGDSNNGKTTIIRRFYDLNGQAKIDEEGKSCRPVILAQAPPVASEKEMLIQILRQFFCPLRASNTAIQLRHQVLGLMDACQVKMLIIDEIHSLLISSSVKQREVMNGLKYLSNELRIPIVGIGTKAAQTIIQHDEQLASRFPVIDLPKWKFDKEFRSLLASFECFLPLRNPSMLAGKDLSGLIYSISDGNLGNVRALLIECAEDAIKSGKEQIDLNGIQENSHVCPTKGARKIR